MHRPGSRDPSLACIEIPAFPLQILLKERPAWRPDGTKNVAFPVVVVDEDRPQGLVTHANGAARRAGIVPGQRYAHALGLAREVRAGVVPPGVIGAAIAHVLARLRAFSPNIEPSEDEPGVFWVDVSGLGGLYDTMLAWAREVAADLRREGFAALVAIGFSRFGTYAAVKSLGFLKATTRNPLLAPKSLASPSAALAAQGNPPGLRSGSPSSLQSIRVMTHREGEKALAMQVPLAYLAISPAVRERLDRIGVRTLGELAALPAAGVMKRWGPEAHALHRLAQGLSGRPEAELPHLAGLARLTSERLNPTPEVLPARARTLLDFLEHDAHRLLFRVKSLLDEVLALVRERQALVAELLLELGFEAHPETRFGVHRFRPAAPTLDAALLLDLVRLRLESVDLRRGLVEVRLEVVETPANPDQMRLFKLGPHQDGEAAARALARVQAELGETAVGTMALRDSHLPRARQAFEPLRFDHGKKALAAPRLPPTDGPPPLVRRLYARPEPLPPRPRDLRNDGWQPRDPAQGTIVAVHGPFVIAGGWWLDKPRAAGGASPLGEGSAVHREYAFVETKRGDILWIFHDRRRRRWFEEGRIE